MSDYFQVIESNLLSNRCYQKDVWLIVIVNNSITAKMFRIISVTFSRTSDYSLIKFCNAHIVWKERKTDRKRDRQTDRQRNSKKERGLYLVSIMVGVSVTKRVRQEIHKTVDGVRLY